MYRYMLTTTALALALTLPMFGAHASSDDKTATVAVALTPQVDADIRAQLTSQGYQVRKVKIDDGLYEAYALKDNQRYEIYLDSTLKIVKTKTGD